MKKCCLITISILFLLFLTNELQAQNTETQSNQIIRGSKFELSGGFGEPEFFNVKIKYGQNLQIGICIGGYIGHGLSG